MLARAEHCLLNYILRVLAVSDNPEYGVFERSAVSLEQFEKCLRVSRHCFIKQVVLGRHWMTRSGLPEYFDASRILNRREGAAADLPIAISDSISREVDGMRGFEVERRGTCHHCTSPVPTTSELG
jgi:hypothetical protein